MTKGLCRCNQVKNLEMGRLFCVILHPGESNVFTMSFRVRKRAVTMTSESGDVITGFKDGGRGHKPRNADRL